MKPFKSNQVQFLSYRERKMFKKKLRKKEAQKSPLGVTTDNYNLDAW